MVAKIDFSYYNDNNNYLRNKREVDSIDDCFDDLEEPTYGFRAKVSLVENSPCILGSTCRGSPTSDYFSARSDEGSWHNNNNNDEYYPADDVIERQTGEEFFSEAPPDCRLTCQ